MKVLHSEKMFDRKLETTIVSDNFKVKGSNDELMSLFVDIGNFSSKVLIVVRIIIVLMYNRHFLYLV